MAGTVAARRKTAQRAAPSAETQGQWSRVIWLDRQIREGSYPSVQDLQEEFCIARRTAFETVSFLRDSLDAPLVYSKQKKGYYYEDPTYALPAMFLREGELLAILLAEQVTRQYLGTPLEQPLRAAVQKISRYLPDEVRLELGDVSEAFHFAGGGGLEVPLHVMTSVQQAIRERRILRIRYYTASRNETGDREIEPHFLTNVRGDWMVVSWDRGKEQDRVFMLSRIQECELLNRRFRPRAELGPGSYSRDMFLTEHTWEPYQVALRFDDYQARWIRERTWHPSQQVEEQDGGGLILRLTVSGEGDLLRWILGYGSHVEVLEPPHLRARVAEETRRTAALYRE